MLTAIFLHFAILRHLPRTAICRSNVQHDPLQHLYKLPRHPIVLQQSYVRCSTDLRVILPIATAPRGGADIIGQVNVWTLSNYLFRP
jgi:hypothetical protein